MPRMAAFVLGVVAAALCAFLEPPSLAAQANVDQHPLPSHYAQSRPTPTTQREAHGGAFASNSASEVRPAEDGRYEARRDAFRTADSPAGQHAGLLPPVARQQPNREESLPLPPPSRRAPSSKRTGPSQGPSKALATVGSSLAIVLSLFFAVAWITRRAMPKSAAALPGEVIEVLGRAPLAGRQQMHLLRVGNKLVLVSLTPNGAETLAEITDAVEVDRICGLCRRQRPDSVSATFRQVLDQMGGERTSGSFVGDAARRT